MRYHQPMTILVPLDFSSVTDGVVNMTEAVAKALNAKAILLHVEPPEPDFVGYEPGPQHVRDNVAHQVTEDHEALHAIRDQLQGKGIDTEVLIIQGPIVEKILSEAARRSVDHIIIGSHGHGALYHLLVGSVCEGVLKRTTCPVTVVPTPKVAD
jgi:nucleotide-binding universal stress UspA family protein